VNETIDPIGRNCLPIGTYLQPILPSYEHSRIRRSRFCARTELGGPIPSGRAIFTVNERLPRADESQAYFLTLTFAPVDHFAIRNTCLIESNLPEFQRIQAGMIKDRDREDEAKGRERRGVQRTRVRRSAKIIVPRRSPVIHCTVQNITSGGACLKVANTFGVPDNFELTFELGRTRRPCRVVWRTDDQLGVSFESEERTAKS
jgi:hypothetical protein